MSDSPEERAFRALTEKITQARGVCCDAYKDRCLRRRIAVRMRARGVHSFGDYSRLLDADGREYDRLLDALTINVTKFFRNVETWTALAPFLVERWKARSGAVQVWSAGCASGEEPYTIAAALAETARTTGTSDWLPRAQVLATDIDRQSLERATAARYAAAAFSETPAEVLRRWIEPPAPDGTRTPVAAVRALVTVQRHDLTTGRPPGGPFDLVVCRNVVIYFDRDTQERLFQVFASALRPEGLLLLGKVETLLGPARELLRMENPRERIYRRPA
ncbi:MAG TPA: protein-glutamate O-methyltransferase CheR [Gemmatimonadales bacterium]|nr:protein-glutamate O-methyltransferase CheR [Gemmatimonadales bacterium]